ncbi:class I SAM-dependent methyltransferase [uncultured Thermanaerothrix sp.]|uniref:class I SAM-dependent methyltransferase n=1 Tax=uncultured Thermanaerothrix sp. TaxID=1195149 RepID=UPI0026315003|nr:class I SAM-dependent methyltransferase [uncultured Thermanaerothrix sp.]
MKSSFRMPAQGHPLPQVSPPQLLVLTSPEWEDYALLDSGQGLKLERYGNYLLVRPEAEAIWKPALPAKAWAQAHARFQPLSEESGGTWELLQAIPDRWSVRYKDLHCWIQRSTSRHVGLFPEQASQWDWIRERIRAAGRPINVLNLFGYTGLATLAAAQAGAHVTHVDASRKAIAWARENQSLSGLQDAPIRWIVDDALKFVQREARRGHRYEGLILDPPKFGRGPKGEVWEFYKLLPNLLQACREVLASEPIFVILTAYAVKASAITLYYAVSEMMSTWKGRTEAGEIALIETSAGRLLPTAIFARWST